MNKVEISEDARDYILNKSKAITIESMPASGCWGVSYVPVVFVKEPSAPEDYEEVTIDGVKVYIYKGAISDPDGVKISLKGSKMIYQSLEVEGLTYCF